MSQSVPHRPRVNPAGKAGLAPKEPLRGSFAERLAVLESIAGGEPVAWVRLPDGTETEAMVSASPGDRLRALEMMAKYGLGPSPRREPRDTPDVLEPALGK